jgi:hypothetical protein
MVARLAMQDGQMDEPQKMQSPDDDDHARDLAEQRQVGGEELARGGRGRAEHDEHGGEAEHEGDRRQHHGVVDVARRLILAGELVERGPADKREIRRDQRQHAWAQEAQHAREQRADIGDLHSMRLHLHVVMAGSMPAIHDFDDRRRRGWPGQARP